MKQYLMESRPSSETCSEPRPNRFCLLSALSVLCLGWVSLVGLSCSGGGGLSDFSATTELPEFNDRGEYDPYYSSGENGFSSIDLASFPWYTLRKQLSIKCDEL